MAVTWKKVAYESDVITKALIDAEGDIIYGSADNTPAILSRGDNDQVLTLKAGVPSWEDATGGTGSGKKYVSLMLAEATRGAGGSGSSLPTVEEVAATGAVMDTDIGVTVLAQQTIGIADNNLIEVDGTPNSGEFAKFTASGLEGRTVAEMQSDLSIGGGGNNLIVNSGFWAASRATLVNFGSAVEEDDCSADNTANWTKGSCTLTFDTDHYVMNPTGAGAYAWNLASTFKTGALYKISIDVKDGTSASVSFWLRDYGNDGNNLYWSTRRETTSSWVTHTFIYCYQTGSGTGLPMIYIATDPGGDIQFKNYTLYEVVSQWVDGFGADWHTQTSTLTTQRVVMDTTHCRGVYGLKITKGADTAEYYQLNSTNTNSSVLLSQYMGQTVTLAVKVYSDTATDNIKIQIVDSNSTEESSFATADSLQTLSVSKTIGTDITYLYFRVLLDGDTNDVAYISQSIAVIGSSVSGWSHPANERIMFEITKVSNFFDNWDSLSSTTTYMHPNGDSNGAVGVGSIGTIVYTNINEATSAGTEAYFSAGIPSYYNYVSFLYGQPNDIPRELVGIIDLDYRYGDYRYTILASGATMDFNHFKYRGIIVR